MTILAATIDTASLRKAYDAVNSKMQDLNSQVVKHNAKTVIKTSLLFASIVAASIFTMAAVSLLGYVFSVPICKTLLVEIAIGFTAGKMIVKTFGKIMYNKMELNTAKLLTKINSDLNKTIEANVFSINALLKDVKMNLAPVTPEFKLAGNRIEENRVVSFAEVKKVYTRSLQDEIKKTQTKRDQETNRRLEEKNRGLLSFLFPIRREKSLA